MRDGVGLPAYQVLVVASILLLANFGYSAITISSLEELNKIGRDPSYPLTANYVLTEDIDASETRFWPGGFQPIGDALNRFTGTFDGGGHEIRGLYIDRPNNDYVGLFGFVQFSGVGSGGMISNLRLKDCVIIGRNMVGGIVGDLYQGGVISKCVVEGEVYGGGVVGGIAGICAGSSIFESFSLGKVVCTSGGTGDRVGGLVGYVNMGGTVQGCYSHANIQSQILYVMFVGGLVGQLENNSSVFRCYSTGSVRIGGLSSDVGGLIGKNISSEVKYSFWDIETSGTTYSDGGIGLPTQEMKRFTTYSEMGWDISDDPCGWCLTYWVIYDGVSYPFLCEMSNRVPDVKRQYVDDAEAELISMGFKTSRIYEYNNTIEENYVIDTVPISYCALPYYDEVVVRVSQGPAPSIPISTIEELQMIGNDPAYPPDNAYHLVNDIDATGTRQWNGGKGFIPIQNFNGQLHGNGHKIFGLYINNEDNPAMPTGLFSTIVSNPIRSPEITNLVIENAEVRGIVEVGMLVGRVLVDTHPYPSIYSVIVQGKVYGVNKVGGLVGAINGGMYIIDSSIRVGLYAITPPVPGYEYWNYGGLVGYVSKKGVVISRDSFIGSINGPIENYIGGFVGYANASDFVIDNSHANAYMHNSLPSCSNLGGLVGYLENGEIYSSYAVPRFYDPTQPTIGGLIGEGSCANVTVNASFWDSQYSGVSSSACGGVPLSTAEMQTRATFELAGWDFNSTWGILEGLSYPLLRSERFAMPSLIGVDIDSAVHSLYEIGIVPTVEEQCSNVIPEGYVVEQSVPPSEWLPPFVTPVTLWQSSGLCPPINVSSIEEIQLIGSVPNYPVDGYYILTQDIDASVTSEWNGGEGFAPIPEFRGIFDGAGHIIKNLFINRPSESHTGLFAIVLGTGRVRNVYLFNTNITGGTYIGGIAGENFGQITNCGVHGYITTTYDLSDGVGGLLGVNRGNVEKSIAVAQITGHNNVGGLVGINFKLITDSYALCNIVGCSEVGGFVGYNNTEDHITNSYCASSITMLCMGNYGGFTGLSQPDKCESCFWDIELSGINFSECGEGKTTSEMQQQSTFENVGWDFSNIWGIIENETYPFILTNPIIHIQDYAGLNFDEVKSELTAKAIIVKYEYICNNSTPAGAIIDNTFKNRDVPIFHTVYFWVSSGPCTEGVLEGEGVVEGTPEGTPEGEGVAEGTPEGTPEGEGLVEGTPEGTPEGEGVAEGTPEGIPEGEGLVEGTPEGEGLVEGEGIIEGEGERPPHSADQDGNWQISLRELLRVIQFFNMQGYHCALPGEESEDGYIPGFDGDKSCRAHASDYNPQDWRIGLSEVLRLIQFFNMGGYHPCPDGEDGYCPGVV